MLIVEATDVKFVVAVKSCSRKRRKKAPAVTSPYDGMFVSQLLSCRDKLLEKTLPPLNGPQDTPMPTPELEALLNESTPQKASQKADTSPQTTGNQPPVKDETTEIHEDTHGFTKDQLHSDTRSRSESQGSVVTPQRGSTDGATKVMPTNLGNPFVMGCERDVSQKFIGSSFGAPLEQQRPLFPGREKLGHAPVRLTTPVRMTSTLAAQPGYGFPVAHQQKERCDGDGNAMYAVRHPGVPPNVIHMMEMSGDMTPSHSMVVNNAVVQAEPPGGAGQQLVMQTLSSPSSLGCQHADFDQRGQFPAAQYWPYAAPTRWKATMKECQPKGYNSVFSSRSPCPNVDVRQMWQSHNMAGNIGGAGMSFHKNSMASSTISPHIASRDANEQQMELQSPVDNSNLESNAECKKFTVDVSTDIPLESTVVMQPKCAESQPPEGTAVTSSPSIKRESCSGHHSDVSPDSLASDSLGSHTRDTSLHGDCHTSGCKTSEGDTDCGTLTRSATADSKPSSDASVTDSDNVHSSAAVLPQPIFSACDFPASNLLSAAARGQLGGHSVVSPTPLDLQTVASEMQHQSPQHVHQSQLLSGQQPAPGYGRQTVNQTPPAGARTQLDSAPVANGELPVGSAQQSPIQMVQNMISGLEATQNQLAMIAMSKKSSSRRRRTAYSSDLCGQQVSCQDGSGQRNSGGSDFTCSFAEKVTNSNEELVETNMASMYTTLVPTGMISSSGMPPMSVGTVTAVTNAITQLIPSTQQTNHGLQQEQTGLLKPASLQEMHAGTAPHATIGLLLGQQPHLAQQVINQQMMVLQQPSLDQVIGQQVMMGQPPTAQCPPLMHVVNGLGTPVNPVVMINQLGQSADPTHPVMLTSVTPMVMAGYHELPQDITKDVNTVGLDKKSDQFTCGHVSDDPQLDGHSGQMDATDQVSGGDGQKEALVAEAKRGQRSCGKRLVGRKGRKGKRKDRCKKSSTPTIASMLQAAHSPAAALQQQVQLAAAVPSQPVQLSLTTPMLQTQLLQQTAANFSQGLVSDVQLCAGQLLTAQQLQFGLGGVAMCPTAGDSGHLVTTQDSVAVSGAAVQNYTMPNVELLMKQLSAAAQNPTASAQILQSWAQHLQGQNNLLLKNLQSLQQQHQQLLSGATTCVTDGNTTSSPVTEQHQQLLSGATTCVTDGNTTSSPVTEQHCSGDTIQARNPVLANALAQGVCGTPTVDGNIISGTSAPHQVESSDQNGSTEASQCMMACNSDDDAPSSVDLIYNAVVDAASSGGKVIIAEDHNSDMSDPESSTHGKSMTGETVSPTDSGSFAMNSIPNPMNLTAAVSAVMKGQQLDAYTCETVVTATSRSRTVRHMRTSRFRAHSRAIRRRHRLDLHNSTLLRKRSVAPSNASSSRGDGSTVSAEVVGSVVSQTSTALDLTMPPAGSDTAMTTEAHSHDGMTPYGSSSVLSKTSVCGNSEMADSHTVQKHGVSTDDDILASNHEDTSTSNTEENTHMLAKYNDESDDNCHGGNTESCHGDDTDMLECYQEETMETLEGNQEENMEMLDRGREDYMEVSVGCHDDNIGVIASCQVENTGIFEGCQGERLDHSDSCHDNNRLQDTCEKAYSEVLDSPSSVRSDQSAFTAASLADGDFGDDSDQDEPINLSNDRTTAVSTVESSSHMHQSELRLSKDSDVVSFAANDGDELIDAQSARAPSSGYDDSSDECCVLDWPNDSRAGHCISPVGGDIIRENGDIQLNNVYTGSNKVDTTSCHISREAKRLMTDRQVDEELSAGEGNEGNAQSVLL